ncbi:hypothetical protein JOD67_000731 [Tenggerimyces flavus]|nr:hypothetical protein [Tenggerimyces flavus]
MNGKLKMGLILFAIVVGLAAVFALLGPGPQ